jgi:mRNA interferase RelE/StbE
MYEILFSPSAQRDHKKLPREVLKHIDSAIETLKDSPRPKGCKKLTNRDAYRIRVADYRIIYEINDKTITILVVRIRHRREVYLD